ncbi:N utilization substance protein B [Rhizomicrobium palustre]|jgi:N utilization substance protein B|uniref:Transcription antitermination protein NusB n=1 Tax=Rhizomicrobium palustre TaxID=189966 RepID=A0A846N3J3_9PROT|nr:transcription antitermination factor NusB [Rhizomicrobium palustre]NIK89782.1 N utilization substance protein B [Rhizomicrobium palustre]
MINSDSLARRAARLAVVQALYQMEITGVDADSVTEEFSSFRFRREPEVTPGEPDEEFFADLVHGVPARQAEIDDALSKCLAANWRLSRVDSIVRAILRSGAYELIARADVPAKVVIDEYVELAKGFEAEQEMPFINAALDKLAHRKRAAEFGEKAPEGDF